MRKILIVAIGLGILLGMGVASAEPRHGAGWSRDYYRGPRHGWHGHHGGWHGYHGYWGPGWRHYGGWGWYGPHGVYGYAGYYPAPVYTYPSHYPVPCYAPSVSYEPMGSEIVTDTVTVVE